MTTWRGRSCRTAYRIVMIPITRESATYLRMCIIRLSTFLSTSSRTTKRMCMYTVLLEMSPLLFLSLSLLNVYRKAYRVVIGTHTCGQEPTYPRQQVERKQAGRICR